MKSPNSVLRSLTALSALLASCHAFSAVATDLNLTSDIQCKASATNAHPLNLKFAVENGMPNEATYSYGDVTKTVRVESQVIETKKTGKWLNISFAGTNHEQMVMRLAYPELSSPEGSALWAVHVPMDSLPGISDPVDQLDDLATLKGLNSASMKLICSDFSG